MKKFCESEKAAAVFVGVLSSFDENTAASTQKTFYSTGGEFSVMSGKACSYPDFGGQMAMKAQLNFTSDLVSDVPSFLTQYVTKKMSPAHNMRSGKKVN